MNLMRALIRGVWILKYDWIVASIENNQWQNEELFEMEAVSKAVKVQITLFLLSKTFQKRNQI